MEREERWAKMDWKKPEFSKSMINKAGKAISKEDFSKIEKSNAYKIVNNWRSSHARPLQHLYTCGKQYADNNEGIIVVQRLKRLESIVAKLQRFPGMGLETMQDLGGCRVIVKDMDEVYKVIQVYKESGMSSKLVKEYDYIAKPKEDGYRSIHLVYEYAGEMVEYVGLKTEAQIRTSLQHAWATAVEALGLQMKVNIKGGEGDKKTRRYMELISALFAAEENTPLSQNVPQNLQAIFYEAMKLDEETNALSIIRAVQMAPVFSGGMENVREYYVIRVEAQTGDVKVYSYDQSQFEAAADYCAEIEKNNHGAFAVLVSAKDAASLLKAYPNYLTDAKLFVAQVNILIKKYSEPV